MKLLNKKSFTLPFIGRDRYVRLLRLGLGYNKVERSFYVKDYNSVEKIIDAISDIMGDEKASFLQTCILCGEDISCLDCKYKNSCETKDLPFQCICPICLQENK